ncbi:MAG: RNA polymerase sigma factor [Candidatus Acidiferrales bacterium]
MNGAIPINDDGLLRRMLAGDEDAFALLYRRKHPAIYRFALHMSGNATVAEDVTQEVFMTLIRDAKRFDPERGSLSGFLFGIARNHVRKRWEQDRRSVPLPDEAGEAGQVWFKAKYGEGNGNGASGNGAHGNTNGTFSTPARADSEFESLEAVGRVRQAIATLPENYREVVVLCELEEMSYEETAAALDCPVGTVRSRLHRARALLLEKLREPAMLRGSAAGR